MNKDKLRPEQLARTVELDASYNGHTMHAYMVPGMCGLRSFHGFDGKYNRKEAKVVHPSPSDIVLGIVQSGISGCVMIITAVDVAGAKRAAEFKTFIEKEGLGRVTVTPGIQNQYTSRLITTMVYEYDIRTVVGWAAKTLGQEKWKQPDGWHSITDKVHMDSWFYSGGGRPLSEKTVSDYTGVK